MEYTNDYVYILHVNVIFNFTHQHESSVLALFNYLFQISTCQK
jgi:hypothetical protein